MGRKKSSLCFEMKHTLRHMGHKYKLSNIFKFEMHSKNYSLHFIK